MIVAFYKGTHAGLPGVFNRLVRWWTRGSYSHAELVFGTPTFEGKWLCASSSRMDGGVRFKLIDIANGNWDLIILPDKDSTNAQAWFTKNQGCGFDTAGILGFVWRRLENNRGKYFCTEAIASALGFEDAWRFDPNTLAATLRRLTRYA